jgi:endogenous inhibitor of DNA gyrase (YacG/DUF329 family)
MGMFSFCPKCGKEVEINKFPEAPGKSSQSGPPERLANTPVTCPACGNSFRPESSFLKST